MTPRPTPEELEARVRERIDLFVPDGFRDDNGVWHDWPHRLDALAALTELTARAEEAEALDAWASSMPDAGFTDSDPRWDWWHRRPRSTP